MAFKWASVNRGNRKRKWKTEAESVKAEIGKWSSILVALMAYFAHARSVWGEEIALLLTSASASAG